MLQLKAAREYPQVESWDDDLEMDGFDDLPLRQASTTTAFSTSSRPSRHRESVSSRMSNRSGEDDSEWQLPIGEEDPAHAIRHAHNAGVPIPANIPASALLGGTIKKLGTKKKPSKDNYEDDIEFPIQGSQDLKLSVDKNVEYPATLRNTSIRVLSGMKTITPGMMKAVSPVTPPKAMATLSFQDHLEAMHQSQENPALEKFRDDDADVFGDIPTIKIGKTRSPLKTAGFYALPQGQGKHGKEDDIMDGLDFGNSNSPLKLPTRKAAPITPAHLMPSDLDVEGFEASAGSFGSSVHGSRPSGRSDRSSSFTALSPSIFSPTLSSSLTVESDDGLEGLVLPSGPVNFNDALKRRLESVSPDQAPAKRPEMQAPPKDDFFDDLEIDDGKIFESGKLATNRNVKQKTAKSSSPTRRGGTTITFTNKVQPGTTRIPKPSPIERPRSKMETIAENGPATQPRRTQSRMLNHSAQSSITSIPTPTTPTFIPPSVPATPTKRGLGTRSSTQTMRQQPTTTSSQLLKAKRSMPLLPAQSSQARPQSMYARPPSRNERTQRPPINRPKTPIERFTSNRPHAPFISAGSTTQSHHVSAKQTRFSSRPTSSDSNDHATPTNRPLSRLSSTPFRPKTPNVRNDVAPESLSRQAAAKRTLTKPTRRRAYGDGTELDGFDDLLTSRDQENKFTKQPREVQSSHTLRSVTRNSGDLRKNFSAQQLPSVHASTPRNPLSPQRQEGNVPSFARDTAASRLAREQRVARLSPQPTRNPQHASEGNLNARFKDQLTVKVAPSSAPRTLRRTKKPSKPLQLIANLGSSAEVKSQKGMHYNPVLCKWEGNETALVPFEALPVATIDRKKASTPINHNHTHSKDGNHSHNNGSISPTHRGNGTPKPALIAPVGQNKGVHVVGGMVFDPSRMCWLKIDAKMANAKGRYENSSTLASTTLSAGGSTTGGPSGGGGRSVTTATEDDEEDPFAGIPDMEDERKVGVGAGAKKSEDEKKRRTVSGNAGDASSDDDWGIGEDFDVGPEFVRRQKRDEERCRRKTAGWTERFSVKPRTAEEMVGECEEVAMQLFGYSIAEGKGGPYAA